MPTPEPDSSALPDAAIDALCEVVGRPHVFTQWSDRLAYGRDRLPWGTFRLRQGMLPGALPAAIAMPADAGQVAALVALARARGLTLIPFGAGSGVMGGTLPSGGEIMVDMKRMNRLVELNTEDGTATVEAGMNGDRFEQALVARGFTAGHLPQSIAMSTVGGWAACRGAGQASSRYGKIEDMVLGLQAVLPDGRQLDIRPVARRSVGPSVKDLVVGSEGTLAIITQLTLRVWRKPAWESGHVLRFPSLEAGLGALRAIMQSELRPQVARLYDEVESAARLPESERMHANAVLCILKFAGLERLARTEAELALEIAADRGGVPIGNEPYLHWERTRYHAYSTQWQSGGHYMDTVEIVAPWSRLPRMYRDMHHAVHALHPDVHFGAHWSHVYAEGACQYMTIRIPPMDDAAALALHEEAWDRLQTICLDQGGSIAHHHGCGRFRAAWQRRELGVAQDVLQSVKDALDPHNLFNPGALALRARGMA